ncbi:HlyD family secretion protein [Ferrovibrio sp.]|uniref:HlyD family secretion protein n=1 Tax=Ferrovibrio sp. TaxID=1917215 RepID=UPI0035B0AFA9
MKKKIILSLFALALLGTAGHFGWQWWSHGRFIESTDNAYVAADMSVISSKISGYLQSLEAVENRRVKAGDVLFRIDDADYRAKLAQAEALLATRRAAMDIVDRQLNTQQASIAEAEASLRSSRADLTRTDDDLRRYNQLASGQYVSTQKLETAQTDQRKAKAALERAEAGRSVQRSQIAVLQANREQAMAMIAQAEAEVAMVKLDLENTVVRAPIDGVVGNRTAQLGQYVRPGVQLMVIVPLQEAYVVANFKETQLRDLRPGQKAQIKVDAYPGQVLQAHIDSLAPASGAKFSLLPPDNATGNFTKIVQRVPVKLVIDKAAGNPVDTLVPGMSVLVEIDRRARPE